MTVSEKLSVLRELMKARGADILLIPSDDYHQSEYVGDFFKAREFISGFNGSAGTLVITKDSAKLFTDGRYYIQAERQLCGSTIDLMRWGSEGVPTPTEYILSLLKDENRGLKTVAFDGKCVSAQFARNLEKKLPNGTSLLTDTDFPALIWKNRPALPSEKIWRLDAKYSGKSHGEKLAELRGAISDASCDAIVISSLCDIAWLYNLRGGDVKNTPVFLSYAIITKNEDKLFVNESAVQDVKSALEAEGVTVLPYGEFYAELSGLSGISAMVDYSAVSEAIVSALKNCKITDKKNPTLLMKAKKNPVELENTRLAHIAEGLALTRLMLELKYGSGSFNELTVEEYMISLRRECAKKVGVTYIGEAFGAVCAFGANAAMMHYSATPDSYAEIDKNAPVPMFLIDTGGQYLEGTTDTTRTFVLGDISEEIMTHYTLTCMGNLRLASLKFLFGVTGANLDITARQPLWDSGIDYRCGTGHGVGHILSVHEGPNSIHFGKSNCKLEEGMITTDEPGVYVEGSHGIRLENELITKKAEHNEYGQFMCFENITYCPFDLDGIKVDLLDKSDIKKLNDYHQNVYTTLAPYLCGGDREKLAYLTRAVD